MHSYRLDFANMEWRELSVGAREKSVSLGDQKIRLLEFDEDFVELEWCERGHTGYVLSGEMEINFNGMIERFKTGDGIHIPPGTAHRHKHERTFGSIQMVLFESI